MPDLKSGLSDPRLGLLKIALCGIIGHLPLRGRCPKGEQVAQGQYVVSDTRCPALSDYGLEGKKGSGPKGDEVL